MVYFNCSTAKPGETGIECRDSCQIQDMDCVSKWSFVETEEVKKKITLVDSLIVLLFGPVA